MLAPDTTVHNRYRVVRLIGAGGMGAVYEAVDGRLGNRVALKQTTVHGDEVDRAFEREARLLAELRHPALPKVIDFFSDDQGQFLVMEYIPGTDLAVLLDERRQPFPLADVLDWGEQLLRVLDYLHRRQPPVVHRDIKPQNLKLTAEREIILLDFGLAKGASQAQTEGRSLRGYTLRYAPLEQIQGVGTDPRSDLYALAATLFHLLTGNAPPDALSRALAIARGTPDPLPLAHELHPRVPPRISWILSEALMLRPEERTPSAAAMRAAWVEARRAITSEATRPIGTGDLPTVLEQRPDPLPATPASIPARRSPSWVWLVWLLVVVAVTASVAWALLSRPLVALSPTPPPVVQPSVAPSATGAPAATPTAPVAATSAPTVAPRATTGPTLGATATAAVGGQYLPGRLVVVSASGGAVVWSLPQRGEPLLERPWLYPGALVEVVQQQGDTLQIRTPEGVVGWLRGPLDQVVSANLAFVGERGRFPASARAQVVWSRGIPLRESYSSQASQIVLMAPGQQMTVEEALGDWLRVTLDDGQTGWARWYYDQSVYIDVVR